MRRLLSLLREIVWLSVTAVAVGVSSIVAAVTGAGIQTTLSLSGLAVTMAILSTRQQ